LEARRRVTVDALRRLTPVTNVRRSGRQLVARLEEVIARQ
jgi:hypothetical protein